MHFLQAPSDRVFLLAYIKQSFLLRFPARDCTQPSIIGMTCESLANLLQTQNSVLKITVTFCSAGGRKLAGGRKWGWKLLWMVNEICMNPIWIIWKQTATQICSQEFSWVFFFSFFNNYLGPFAMNSELFWWQGTSEADRRELVSFLGNVPKHFLPKYASTPWYSCVHTNLLKQKWYLWLQIWAPPFPKCQQETSERLN